MCFNGRSVFSFASFRFRLCHPLFPAFTLRLPSSPFLLPASASASYRPQSVRFVMPFLSFFYVTEFIWLFCLLSSHSLASLSLSLSPLLVLYLCVFGRHSPKVSCLLGGRVSSLCRVANGFDLINECSN